MKITRLALAALLSAPCAAQNPHDDASGPTSTPVASLSRRLRPDDGEALRRLRERASALSMIAPMTAAAGTEAKTTPRTYFVTGRAVPADRPLVVRVYSNDGRFVTSTEQLWTSGAFYLNLPAGDYVFEADDNLEYIDSPFFYRTPTRSNPVRISRDTTLPPIQRDVASGEFVLVAVLPCDLVGDGKFVPVLVDATAQSADGARIQRSVHADAQPPVPVQNGCALRYHVVLSPGTYTVAVSPLGWTSRAIGDVTIAADQRLEHEEDFLARDRSLVWRGTLFDTDGQPAAGAFALAYDSIDDFAYAPWPDANGHFEIPYRPGWAVEFERSPFGNEHSSVNHLEILGDAPPPSVSIENLPFESVPENGMLRLYGNGDRLHRFNILFLGDGYTDAHETFTDSNGNGAWDGYVWYDFDGDGVLGDADRYAFYGDAPPLDGGQVPSESGEPFDDVNGDGALSTDDAALFEINARSFLRALFASDFWKDHRDALNAYTLFEPSAQAGASVATIHGQRIDRATRYHTLIEDVGTVSFDRTAALQRALAVLPDVDVVVMLVNDQIGFPAGSAVGGQPGTIGFIAGPYFTWSRDARPAHQLAHLIAGLCDEEALGGDLAVADDEPVAAGCPNASASATDVPWRAWLPGDRTEPSRDLVAGTGIFEGVDRRYRRIYRPSYRSAMSGRSVLFDAPSRAALEHAVQVRAQAVPHGHSAHERMYESTP